MSRFVLLVRTPRAVEAAWVEDGPTVVAAVREILPATRVGEAAAQTCRSVHVAPAAHSGLSTRTALWFWADSASQE